MATKFQIKRTSISGRSPNTTNIANSGYIAAGELAVNLTDEKLYSSNGTVAFEVGANLSSITVAGNAALGKIVANGGLGTSGQTLFSNSTGGLYWETPSNGITVELVNTTSNVTTLTTVSTLQFDENSGFNIVNVASGKAKVEINSTFKFWQVDGVQKLTATGLDTVNFIAGDNITITANGANTPQSIAFSTSLNPTFTTITIGNSTVNTFANSSAFRTTKIVANGVVGTAGKVLTSNGTGGIYWGDATTGGGGGGDLTIISDTFSGNGSNTIFTLSVSTDTEKTFVYLNGILQTPTTDYSVSNTTLTFVTAPPSDNAIEVRSFDIPSVADLTVTSDNYIANGTQTTFTLSTSLSSDTTSLVFLNGITQIPTTDYGISGSTLTFVSAPANGTKVQVTSFTAEDISTTTYTGNGSNTEFTLGTTSTTSKTIVSINGVTQTPVDDYSVSGTTLIFAVAPANNDKIVARAIPSTASSTAGGNTQIQYNKSGSLGGSAGFTFNEDTNNVVIANTLTVPNFILNASNPPANSTSTGTTGTFAWDSSYFYIATGTNTWKKVPITTDGSGGGGGGGGSVAGSNNEIQYNGSGSFAANNKFTFNPSTTTMAIGSNLTINTSAIFIGNSTVNTTIIAGNVDLQGTQLRVGNVVVNGNQLVLGNVTITDTTITVGNSTVNSVISSNGSLVGNGALVTSVDAASVGGNTAATLRSYSDTKASDAYNNAVTYAASNTYVNNTFLPLAGGTLTGALTVNATANVVANLAANNVTIRGDLQIDGNLVVSGTSVTINAASLAVEDNMIYLNNGSQVSHPDLGFAGNYNDGTYKHAGFFRDATDGVWKVFDGYTPEPDASAYIDTSNASFRIANFTANVITANSFSGNGASVTSVDAATVGGNTAATLRSYSDTVAATAYSNAVAYAASNTYVNSTFLPLAGGTLTGALTGRINPRVSSTASTSSITPDISSFDQYCVTAQAVTLAINAPIGTPVDGNRLLFRILDNGTPQTINWNATFTSMGAVLPTLTTANKMIYVGCIYNAANTRWDVIAVTQQA